MKKLILVLLLSVSTAAIAQSSKSYVDRYKDAAIKAMQAHGVPASIILGIAMHESGNGNSKIARYLNNHFGIKGRNKSKDIKSAYKGYGSVEDCYADFIRILQKRSRFDFLFEHPTPYDYRTWVLAIEKGGYAESPTWGVRVLATIKKFKLYELDNQNSKKAELTANTGIPAILLAPQENIRTDTVYNVRKGDTLGAIAKKFNTTIRNIQEQNNLKGSMLQPGQKLKI
ncbi:MAG TPA: glucosaminidase domain-containing protein [Sphingobacteriaceae bacterium]|nr:glucosaminidase domain-containing protein [Sphingobacteriaceae bacterium]